MNVAHLMPINAIGGVECAAASMIDGKYKIFHFKKFYISSPDGLKKTFFFTRRQDSISNYVRCFSELWKFKPTAVIFSLWRTLPLLLIFRLVRPDVKRVLFLHSSVNSHFVDFCLTQLAIRLSTEIWGDCPKTISSRVPMSHRKRCRTISFTLYKPTPHKFRAIAPVFAFWGRLAYEKNIRQSLQLFSKVCGKYPNAIFYIIGPDGGERDKLCKYVDNNRLTANVRFLGPLKFTEIQLVTREVCFYLQTSLFEGMAMSVIEAMQLGLIPVVTPVGEITSYCADNRNCILINGLDSTFEKISFLLNNPTEFLRVRKEVLACWSDVQSYKDSVVEAIVDLINV